jgi:hypothetical protein
VQEATTVLDPVFFTVLIFLSSDCVWIVAGTYPGLTLELLDRKARVFLAKIALLQ